MDSYAPSPKAKPWQFRRAKQNHDRANGSKVKGQVTGPRRKHERGGSLPPSYYRFATGPSQERNLAAQSALSGSLHGIPGSTNHIVTNQYPSPPAPGHHIPYPSLSSDNMDFSTFRESGELSDICVTVAGRQFHLHKFPLYIRSDFFRALARKTLAETSDVKLPDFPGGAETFELVANFCYNKKIDITRENVCRLRCAAEFLQMSSPGNLCDCCDRYLQDSLTAAKLGRDTGVAVDLLLSCRPLGAIIDQTGIVARCVDAILDCWLLSSKWTRRRPADALMTETDSFQKLNSLPLGWFKMLLEGARDKKVRPPLLAKIVQTYISSKEPREDPGMNRNAANEQEEEGQKEKEREKVKPKMAEKEEKQDGAPESGDKAENGEEERDEDPEDKDKEKGETEGKSNSEDDTATPKDANDATGENSDSGKPIQKASIGGDNHTEEDQEDQDLGEVLDQLLLMFDGDTAFAESLGPHWVVRMLRLAQDLDCQCRPMLLRVSGTLLPRFQGKDLGSLPPELLQAVLAEASRDPQHVDQDLVCCVIDGYLLELASKDELDVEVFEKLVAAVPADYRLNHDVLFEVLEKLLKSERHGVSDEDKQKLLEIVDFQRMSESALQRAHTSQLIPPSFITRAALALCSRLRAELDRAADVIRLQEEELGRFGLGVYGNRHGSYPPRRDMTSEQDSDPEPDGWVLPTHAWETPYLPSRLPPGENETPAEEDLTPLSPPGYDPILAKALGPRYHGDPLSLDTHYPLGYCSVHDRYGGYRQYSLGREYSPFDPRYYASSTCSRWRPF